MNKYEFEINYRNESHYWWFVGRRRIVLDLLKRYFVKRDNARFLDTGCGTGIVLDDLSSFALPVGVDLSKEGLDFCKQRGLQDLVMADVSSSLPFKSETFDFVTILGVLNIKWVKDDANVIKEIYRIMKKGGIVISDESAFKILMSRHNERIGAVKRYHKEDIRKMMEDAGFKVMNNSYWNMFLFPVFLAAKILDNFLPRSKRGFTNMELPLPAFINTILIKILYLESLMIKAINLPFGTSIITVGVKL